MHVLFLSLVLFPFLPTSFLLVSLSPCGQAPAQCGHQAEAAGGLVLAGSVLLPAPQALHPGRDGGSGEPRVQQQEDGAYPYRPERRVAVLLWGLRPLRWGEVMDNVSGVAASTRLWESKEEIEMLKCKRLSAFVTLCFLACP